MLANEDYLISHDCDRTLGRNRIREELLTTLDGKHEGTQAAYCMHMCASGIHRSLTGRPLNPYPAQ